MRSTFLDNDVKILLSDISEKMEPLPQEAREELIKIGKKAYELLPLEDEPSDQDILTYEKGIELSVKDTANAVKSVAEKIYKRKGSELILVSLARGGIPAGIMVKRYLEKRYRIKIPHYAITLIGTKGIDTNALSYIIKRHSVSEIQFIDGWSGKGAIINALKQALVGYDGISPELALLSDPANLSELSGTHEDILIASACLNAPTAGLISRAVYSDPILHKDEFYGAVFFNNLISKDKTYDFIEKTVKKFDFSDELPYEPTTTSITGIEEVNNIAKDYNIGNIHFIKPGVGETIRALIRKIPDLILVKDAENKYINYVLEIARQKNIQVEKYPLMRYNVCGMFKDINSDVL